MATRCIPLEWQQWEQKCTVLNVCLGNLLQTSARIMRSSLYGQRIPAQFCNTEPKCLVSTNNRDTDGSLKQEHIYRVPDLKEEEKSLSFYSSGHI